MVEVNAIETEDDYAYAAFEGKSPDGETHLLDIKVEFGYDCIAVKAWYGDTIEPCLETSLFYAEIEAE